MVESVHAWPRAAAGRLSFCVVYATAFARPKRAMAGMLDEPRRLRWGACGVAITAVTYTFVYFFLSRNGGRPTVFAPWLAIPVEVSPSAAVHDLGEVPANASRRHHRDRLPRGADCDVQPAVRVLCPQGLSDLVYAAAPLRPEATEPRARGVHRCLSEEPSSRIPWPLPIRPRPPRNR
jgi:hypothetical protein